MAQDASETRLHETEKDSCTSLHTRVRERAIYSRATARGSGAALLPPAAARPCELIGYDTYHYIGQVLAIQLRQGQLDIT